MMIRSHLEEAPVTNKKRTLPFHSLNLGDSNNCLHRLVPKTPTPITAHSNDAVVDDDVGVVVVVVVVVDNDRAMTTDDDDVDVIDDCGLVPPNMSNTMISRTLRDRRPDDDDGDTVVVVVVPVDRDNNDDII